MQELATIDTTSLRGKAIVSLAVLFVLILTWFGARWQVGHMFAVLTRPDAGGAYFLAQLAGNWAATDPAAQALRAASVDDPAADERVDALPIYQQAVRLGPNDFHRRIDLAIALEHEGRITEAEGQFRKGVELAPNYSESHWNLGNFLLRQGREDDAVTELRYAARGNFSYREQFFSVLWDRSAKDESKLFSACGESAELKTYLAYFFTSRGRADAAVRAWGLLSQDEKSVNAVTGRTIAQALFAQRHFSQSLAVAASLGEAAHIATITNNSFEQVLETQDEPNFGWRVGKPDPKIEVTTDARVAHEGSRSLRLTFRAFNKASFVNPLQTIVVETGKRYRIRSWIRTENLRSGGNPVMTIQNAADDSVITQSSQFAQGTSDWQEVTVEFNVPANTDGIIVSITRTFCGEDCPLSGTVWLDDLRLEKL